MSGLGLVELYPLTVSIFAVLSLILISRCDGGFSSVDEERSLSGHCRRIVGMELTSAGAVVFVLFYRERSNS